MRHFKRHMTYVVVDEKRLCIRERRRASLSWELVSTVIWDFETTQNLENY